MRQKVNFICVIITILEVIVAHFFTIKVNTCIADYIIEYNIYDENI